MRIWRMDPLWGGLQMSGEAVTLLAEIVASLICVGTFFTCFAGFYLAAAAIRLCVLSLCRGEPVCLVRVDGRVSGQEG